MPDANSIPVPFIGQYLNILSPTVISRAGLQYNRYTGSPLETFQNLFTNIYSWGQIVEGLRKSAGAVQMLRRNLSANRRCPQWKKQTTTPGSRPYSLRQVCGFFLSPSTERSRDWTYGLTSLSEKPWWSNHLQMLEQRHHLLLNYFKTLSGGRAGNRTRASHTADWRLTN